MTDSVASSSGDSRLATFWVPMQQKSLLVPQVAIAEVIAQAEFVADNQAASSLLGWFDWRGQSVAVLSYELANGHSLAVDSPSARLAIFNPPTASAECAYFGLRIQGLPRLLRLAEAEVREDSLARLAAVERMAVITQLGKASIPDLEALSRLAASVRR